MNYQGKDDEASSAHQPLIEDGESSIVESEIEDEKTDSTGQSSQNDKETTENRNNSDSFALKRSNKNPDLEKRKSLLPETAQTSSNWFTGTFSVLGDKVATLAVDLKDKTLKAVSGESLNYKRQETRAEELTTDELFLQELYKRVHTQSRLLQDQMTLNIIMEIKDRSRREDEQNKMAMKCGKWRKNIVPLKWISLALLAVIPIFQIPNWCIREKKYNPGLHSDQCDSVNYPNSNMIKFQPGTTTALTILAYILLSIFIVMRLFIKKKSKGAVCRASCMLIMILVSTIDMIWVLAANNRSSATIVNIFNVMLILFFVRAIREVWIQFMQVVIASVPVFAIIGAYLILFTIIFYITFANDTNDDSFVTLGNSSYTVFILFTVSNYPDVQLPFFIQSRFSMVYFWFFLLIGIFLLSNLLLAQIFLNYKKLINGKLKRYSDKVEEYFRELFDEIAEDGKSYLTVEQFTEALGGKDIVDGDKRLRNLIWQARRILDGKIQFQDFAYVLEFTDTIEQQKVQLDRIKRLIKKKKKYNDWVQSYEKAKQNLLQKSQQQSLLNNSLGFVGDLMSSVTNGITKSIQSIEINMEQDIEDKLQEEEDNDLVHKIKKQNRKVCFCFKQKIKKQLQEQLKTQLKKSKKLEQMLEAQNIDIKRIQEVDTNKVVNEYGRIYHPKENHGKWRKRYINCQNSTWNDVPMTVLGILCLFFIPLFQFCHELSIQAEQEQSESIKEQSHRLKKSLIWVNFIVAICFGLEIAMKSYAFGLRRAYVQASWVVKAEFFIQPTIWILWFVFVSKDETNAYSLEVNIISIVILIRSLRVSALLNEIEVWRNFIRTIRALFKPFLNFSLTLYSLYLIYAAIGLEFFGGKINQQFIQQALIDYPDDVSEDWLYLNFNDYLMSMNTLFGVMWQNDWEAIVFMFEAVYEQQKDTAVLLYFITFMQLANLIFVNIIIAFVIDTYQSIDETLQAENEAKELARYKAENDGQVTAMHGNGKTTSLLEELNNDPAQFSRIMEILNSHLCVDSEELSEGQFNMQRRGTRRSTIFTSSKSQGPVRNSVRVNKEQSAGDISPLGKSAKLSIDQDRIIQEEVEESSFGTDSQEDSDPFNEGEDGDDKEIVDNNTNSKPIFDQEYLQQNQPVFSNDIAPRPSRVHHIGSFYSQKSFGSQDMTNKLEARQAADKVPSDSDSFKEDEMSALNEESSHADQAATEQASSFNFFQNVINDEASEVQDGQNAAQTKVIENIDGGEEDYGGLGANQQNNDYY